MTATTPTHELPYPEPSDPNDVPGDMQALAEALDTLIVTLAQADALYLQLIGGTLAGAVDADGNDIDNPVLRAARMHSYSETVVDHGTVSGTVQVDVATGPLHVLELTGATTLEFTGWPSTAAASVTVEVQLGGNALTVDSAVEWPEGVPPDPGEEFAKFVFDARPGRAPHGQLVGTEYA